MTTIVTRAGKGSPLTNNEVDTNFTNLNTAKIETLTSTDTSVTITGTGSSRDLSVPVNPNVVSGPASATDNAVVRFDGTTGKLVQNSTAAIIDDSGNADFLSQKADYFDVDTAATTAAAVGRLRWNATKGTAVLGEVGGNLDIAVGQTLDALVTNAEAITITKGQPVYLFSAVGDRASVKLAYNTSDATSAKTFGIAAENITAGATGLVRCVGVLEGLNLGTYTAGDTLYLGDTAGTLTATKPAAPNHLVYVGLVERANNGSGLLYVRVQNGYELDEIHDVQITSPANGNLLIRDQTNSLWKNALLTQGTGISVTNGAGSITIGLASGYGDTQNPYASKTANYVLAAPNGSAGVPTFRAIVAADIPTLNQNTTGTASNVTGTVAIANGGTGQTTAQLGINALAGAVTSGSYLRGNGTNVVMSTIQAADVPTLNQNTTGSSGSCTGNAATATSATSATSATNATNVANTTTTSASTFYPAFMSANTTSNQGTNTNGSLTYVPSTGTLSATVMSASSDERLKTNWVGLDLDFVSRLADVKHGTFERISSKNREVGVTAQSLKEVLPEAVISDEEGYLSVNYGGAALVAAIELAKEVKELRAEIAALKAKVGE